MPKTSSPLDARRWKLHCHTDVQRAGDLIPLRPGLLEPGTLTLDESAHLRRHRVLVEVAPEDLREAQRARVLREIQLAEQRARQGFERQAIADAAAREAQTLAEEAALARERAALAHEYAAQARAGR